MAAGGVSLIAFSREVVSLQEHPLPPKQDEFTKAPYLAPQSQQAEEPMEVRASRLLLFQQYGAQLAEEALCACFEQCQQTQPAERHARKSFNHVRFIHPVYETHKITSRAFLAQKVINSNELYSSMDCTCFFTLL